MRLCGAWISSLAGSGLVAASSRGCKRELDGNDNNPYELLSEAARMPEAELAPFVKLVLIASIEEYRDDIRAHFEGECGGI